MFTSFLMTAQMHFFSNPSHPRLVFWLMAGSGAASVLCAIVWLKFPFEAQTSSPPSQSIATRGGDNSGSQFLAERDLHYHEAPNQASIRVVSARVPVRHQKRANLVGLDPKNERLDEDFLKAKWLPVAVLPIENRIGQTMIARDVCASIRFNGSTENYVKRAYWAGKRGNVNEISIGDIQSVVIGQRIDDHWYYFDNPRAYPETWGSVSYVKRPDPGRLILPIEGIIAVVTLFHPDDGKPLLTAKLLIGSDGTITRAR